MSEIGARMKVAREALGLSRPAFATKCGGVTVRTLENNEGGANEARACLIAAFVHLGINANWLLTGDGPMLLNPAAELGRLMADARGDIAVQQLAEQMGVPAINLLDMEGGRKIADAETIHDYARLCGADPAELFAARDRALVAGGLLAAPTQPVEDEAPAINVDALAAAIGAMRQLAPDMAPDAAARKIARFYAYMVGQDLITPDGVGKGKQEDAA